jgi:hypothetical protein
MPDDRHLLLYGPYRPPRLRKGHRTTCLLRDCDVVITSWTAARIPWPRCRALHHRGGSGLLMTDELARAVRCESSLAIQHWFGVSDHAVWNWRRALGVGMWEPEGSRGLHQRLSEKGAAVISVRGHSEEECQRRMERAHRLNLAQYLVPAAAANRCGRLRSWRCWARCPTTSLPGNLAGRPPPGAKASDERPDAEGLEADDGRLL